MTAINRISTPFESGNSTSHRPVRLLVDRGNSLPDPPRREGSAVVAKNALFRGEARTAAQQFAGESGATARGGAPRQALQRPPADQDLSAPVLSRARARPGGAANRGKGRQTRQRRGSGGPRSYRPAQHVSWRAVGGGVSARVKRKSSSSASAHACCVIVPHSSIAAARVNVAHSPNSRRWSRNAALPGIESMVCRTPRQTPLLRDWRCWPEGAAQVSVVFRA